MQRSAIILLLLLTLLVISPFAVLANATIVVNTIADEDDVVANSTCSLREAIKSANTNANFGGCVKTGTYGADTITFSPTVFNSPKFINLTSDLPDITSQITITGNGLVAVDGDDVFQAFEISNSAVVTISGFIVLDAGSPAGAGGAINVVSGTVTLNNMVFTSNIASLTGGAIHVASGATVKVNNSSFQNNFSTLGGAIYSDGTLRVSNSSFTNNLASDYGGAITNTNANSVIGGSLFYSNDSNVHGGAYVGIGAIFNSTFYGNHANGVGGAIYNPSAGTLKLIHVTVANNAADADAAGIYLDNGLLSMMNSIVADNVNGTDCAIGGVATTSINYSLIENGGCGITNGVNGNLIASPVLDPNGLQNNGGLSQTLALSPGSPGANAGSNSYRMEGNAAVMVDFNGDGDKADTLSTDQRGTGFPRTNNTTVDMGAFETNGLYTGLTVDTTSDNALFGCTNAANDCSLRGAILIANARSGTDFISFSSSVFSGSQTITLTANLPTITESISINGPGFSTTISGNDTYRHFHIVNGATLSILGLTISHGLSNSDVGGAFYVENGSLSLLYSSIEDNYSAISGGAIYVGTGSLEVRSSNISGNSASDKGGAIYITSLGTLRVSDSSFSNNSATNAGGAVFSETSIFIGGSTFNANTSGMGGGIFTNGGTIFNSTFANNISWSQGGAINNDAALSLSLINVTMSNNSANGGMGGAGVYTGNAALFIMNSILADSTAGGECSTNSGIVSIFSSIIEDGSCGIVSGSNGNIVSDAFLDPSGLQTNGVTAMGGLVKTIALAPSSPAINAGSNAYLSETDVVVDFNNDGDMLDTLDTDQRGNGFNRILQGTVDMGAFEMSNSSFTGLVVDTISDTYLYNCTNAANDCSLRSAIELANARPGADTITFDATVFGTAKMINLNGAFANIRGDLTITGSGSNLLTIDGAFSYRPFYIENSAIVTISGMRVSHAAAGLEDGAAIYLNSGSLTLDNMIFSSNEAPQGNGGAIYANTGSLVITNSSFTENLASNASGGAIYTNTASLSISDSSFVDNTANISGGAIYSNGDIVIRESTFSDNSAGGDGGAIYTVPDMQVLDSLFEGNLATGSGGAIYSVSIHPDYTTIVGSSFGGNQAANGGALVGYVRVVNSSFFGNTATTSGGAIYSDTQSIYLRYVSMGFNSALIGGALYSDDGYIELLNSIVADSTNGGDCAMGAGATLFSIASMLEDDSCNFNETINGNLVADPMFDVRGLQDNGGSVPSLTISPLSPAIDAGNHGGSNAFLFESSFGVDVNGDGDTDDAIDYDQRGTGFNRVAGQVDMGAIEQTASVLLEVDTTSDTNLVICTNAAGDCSLRGAINVANAQTGTDNISFDATVFATAQTITLTGDLPSIDTNMNITGSGQNLLTINGADLYQPFVVDYDAIVSLSAMTISHGYTDYNGGAIHVIDGDLGVTDTNFDSNHADAAGGAIGSANGNLSVANSSFSNNTSVSDGGAIYDGSNILLITNSSFTDNVSQDLGGAIYTESDVVISNSSFVGNSSSNNGGAIYSGGTLRLGHSSFAENSSNQGGAVFSSSNSAVIFNSSFYDNQATTSGGAIGTSNDLMLINVTIFANVSATGGGIHSTTPDLILRNTIIAGNTGGACTTTASDPTINNSLFDEAVCGITDGVNGNIVGQAFLNPVGLEDNGGTTQTIALSPVSPARNAGNNDYLSETIVGIDFNDDSDIDDVLDTDQRGTGFNRVVDGTVDMGAFETNGTFNGLVVDTDDDGTKIFCTSAANDCSLNGAIFIANGIAGADAITFDATVFGTAKTISLSSDFIAIREDLNIDGAGMNMLTIDAEDGRPFTIDNGADVTISDMRIANANTFSNGGAIYIIDASGSSAAIDEVVFENNVVFSGGAIYAGWGTTLSVNNSRFTGNSATSGDGGAINGATSSSITIANSSFSDNSSANNGGAVFSDSAVHIIGSSFSGNSAVNGGAVYANVNANIRIVNSSIYLNTASAGGGAVNVDGISSLLHVTMSANAASSGGGLLADGTVTVMNSIIGNSTGGDCGQNSGSLTISYSLIEDGSCGITSGVNFNLTGEPYLAPFANYGGSMSVLGLLPFSPAINAGNNAYLSEAAVNIDFNNDGFMDDTLTTDQRSGSFSRIINTTVDMGAFEANPSTSVSNIAPIRNYYTTNTPTLTWGRVSWATGYELQISSSTSFGTLLCGGTAVISASELSFTSCELPAGTYYWRVRATSSTGAGAWSAVDIFVIGGGE